MSEIKFEQSLSDLKAVVAKLESDDVSLDEAIELYKQGLELSKVCKDKLTQAETLIKTVIDDQGNEGELSEEY